ncbi:magnesium protoporphyrin IX methyltransferase [Lichenibacterium minor]|nr:magnesium protoporphyrin IX methyltransferase [Lichenibacterium minor]
MSAMTAENDAYETRRSQIETYFDRTAAETWRRLTSDAPVSGIRATVRAGRDRMRTTLLSRLPADLAGRRLFDAGCGTGALAIEAARRGADVVAVDISPTLVGFARERVPAGLRGSVRFEAGDMLGGGHGRFDHVVAMDSLIHYDLADIVRMAERLAAACDGTLLFTFAPRTKLLAAMHAVGRLFPRGERSPSLVPVGEAALRRRLAAAPGLSGWEAGWSERVASGFYTSQAIEAVRR